MTRRGFRARFPRIPALLQEMSFRRFWWGRSLSLLGDQIGLLAFPLTAILVLHTTPVGMAVLVAMGSLPSLVLSIHIGAFVDRQRSRRRIMILADLVRAGLFAAIPVAWALGSLTLPFLVADWVLIGIASVFFRVAGSTMFVALVPSDRYVEANGLLEQSRAGGFLVGPALAGWFIQAFTAPVALLADGLSFLASAVSLALVHPEEPEPAESSDRNLWAGLTFIRTSPVLRPLFLGQLTQSLFRAAFMALYVLYGTRLLHITPAEWGIILGPSSVLAMLGSAFAGRLVARVGLGPALVLGSVLNNWPLLAIPMVTGSHLVVVGVLFLAEGLAGAGSMIRAVTVGTIQVAAIPNVARARVMAAFSMASVGMTPVGALLSALLVWRFGVHPTIWAAVIGGAISTLWLLTPAVRHLSKADELYPEGPPIVVQSHS